MSQPTLLFCEYLLSDILASKGGALGSLPGHTKDKGNRQHPHFNVTLIVSTDGRRQEVLLTKDWHWLSSYMICTSETYSRKQSVLETLTLTPIWALAYAGGEGCQPSVKDLVA